jgi:Flp pilus assembly protein TadD
VAGRFSEARDVAGRHAALHPDDPHVWGNLATSEVLCGDLDAADASLARCTALDPDDIIVRNLRPRIDGYRAGKPLPRTMHELERG